MSSERRRSAGGRRRAGGPAPESRGNGGRRASRGYDDERPAPRRQPAEQESGGFWDDDERGGRDRRSRRDSPPPRRAAAASGGARDGGRRRGDDREGRDGRRRPPSSGSRSEGSRRASGGGRRRPPGRDDEHDDRGPFKRFMAKAWKPALIVCAVGFVGVVAVFGIAYATTPDFNELKTQATSQNAATSIRFEDGGMATTSGEVKRFPIGANEIPKPVKNGVLAAEQRSFYDDPAVSPVGMLRAAAGFGQAGGGSTITQQMARNYYDGLSQEVSYTRKFNEIIIALKVEQSLNKDQVLAQYLNTIFFGRSAYGIQAASQAYFGKDIDKLDNAEGALLGTIIQQPGNFQDVSKDPKMEAVLKERWQYTVDGMVAMNGDDPKLGISQAEADKLEFPKIIKPQADKDSTGYRGYIKTAVTKELTSRYSLKEADIAGGGYEVKTSLDKKYMEYAEKAVKEEIPENTPEETNIGLASVEPQTGEVKAFYGGTDFLEDANNSIDQTGQAGSAFKPYVLATGLSQGISLKSEFNGDSPQNFEGLGEPVRNDSNKSWGTVDLVDSTANSVNTSFVELAIQVQPQNAADTAKKAGIPDARFKTADLGPNIALGTYQVSALDQAAGFSTFANKGKHMPQHMVTEVKNRDGKVIEPNDADKLDSGTAAFDADVAADATYAMEQVVKNGGAKTAALPDGRPVAGKTGTSNSAKSAWFVGFTPQLSTAVGLHRSDQKPVTIPGVGALYGSKTPAAVWKNFMTRAMKGKEIQKFPPPANVGQAKNYGPTPTPTPTPRETEEPDPTPTPTPSDSPSPTAPETTPPPDDCRWGDPRPECQDQPDPPDPTDDPEETDGPGIPW
ncbi:membrane peptidoglycan carboxypeptidase [Murinocardiopsis flavida]|uniref:Membrane peptidoglycan carboxypeptidase n=1 Tax=Murinocardiopsis flavida TaxID=645275 RepID=A0A2P8DE84_9ACTN|nr:transglycosylase domain-containing protein [Murinocardiopsis flavida]PSK95499.1 membrane peptidoglycan carboxypeptidase [Murinocardiopsis flavida]